MEIRIVENDLNLKNLITLVKSDIEDNNKNVTAELDIDDLKELQSLIEENEALRRKIIELNL